MLENSSFTTSNTKTTNFEATASTLKIKPPPTPLNFIFKENRSVPNENLNPDDLDLKQICKLFENLSVSQSKQFLLSLVET